MQKNIRRLEKETATWRQRCEGSNRSLMQMAEQKQADDAHLLSQRRRIDTLERLCRALQARAAAGSGTGPEAEADGAPVGEADAGVAAAEAAAEAAETGERRRWGGQSRGDEQLAEGRGVKGNNMASVVESMWFRFALLLICSFPGCVIIVTVLVLYSRISFSWLSLCSGTAQHMSAGLTLTRCVSLHRGQSRVCRLQLCAGVSRRRRRGKLLPGHRRRLHLLGDGRLGRRVPRGVDNLRVARPRPRPRLVRRARGSRGGQSVSPPPAAPSAVLQRRAVCKARRYHHRT